MNGFVRWLKFSAVGIIGVGVQLGALFLLASLAHLNYLVATALAVEAAVAHNFIWHQRFTWRDRETARVLATMARLARFNAGNGAISLLGNVLLMRILVGQLHVRVVPANLVSIAACALANFIVSDRWVFVTADYVPTTRAHEWGDPGS
jgi:putative flippase GtrA